MENVITVGLQTGSQSSAEAEATLAELERLVETAGGRVVTTERQRRERPDPALYIGKGKAESLRHSAERLHVQTVVFDEELKPGQQRNLEEALGLKVIDRTRLILDIFARRARTREGQLQVEHAQLSYLLPRITERFGRFEQQVGGIGTRGPGERKLEVDKRRLRDRMALLSGQIEKVRQERQLQREVRRGVPVPQVALVGYTNAGKSTFLNALLDRYAGAPKRDAHHVYADDKLFATLDPTTRRVRLPGGRVVLFTDTVGFIRKLPTALIAAFRATLEETANADLLVHVVDASDPDWEAQERAVLEVLASLEAGRLPRLTAYNKIDRVSPTQKSRFRERGGLWLSARTGTHLEETLAAIEHALSAQWIEKTLMIPFHDGRRLARLHEFMDVLSQEPTTRGLRVKVRAHPSTLAQFQEGGAW